MESAETRAFAANYRDLISVYAISKILLHFLLFSGIIGRFLSIFAKVLAAFGTLHHVMPFVLNDGSVGDRKPWSLLSDITDMFYGVISFFVGFFETLVSPEKGLSRQGINRTGIRSLGSSSQYRRGPPRSQDNRNNHNHHHNHRNNNRPTGRPGSRVGGIDHSDNCYGGT